MSGSSIFDSIPASSSQDAGFGFQSGEQMTVMNQMQLGTASATHSPMLVAVAAPATLETNPTPDMLSYYNRKLDLETKEFEHRKSLQERYLKLQEERWAHDLKHAYLAKEPVNAPAKKRAPAAKKVMADGDLTTDTEQEPKKKAAPAKKPAAAASPASEDEEKPKKAAAAAPKKPETKAVAPLKRKAPEPTSDPESDAEDEPKKKAKKDPATALASKFTAEAKKAAAPSASKPKPKPKPTPPSDDDDEDDAAMGSDD